MNMLFNKKAEDAFVEDIEIDDDDDDIATLTEWGCLYSVLNEYGIKCDHITGKAGFHIVEDFVELMVKCGYFMNVESDETPNPEADTNEG